MVTVILFKVQSAGFSHPEPSGKSLFVWIEVFNHLATEGDQSALTIGARHRSMSQSSTDSRRWSLKDGAMNGRVVTVSPHLVMKLPTVAASDSSQRLFRFQLQGSVPLGGRIEVDVTQAVTEEIDTRRFNELAERLETDRAFVLARFKGATTEKLSRWNIDVVKLLQSPSGELSPATALGLLQANLRRIKRNDISSVAEADIPAPNTPNGCYAALKEYWTAYVAAAVHDGARRKALPASAALQEVALNACLSKYLAGGRLDRSDLVELYESCPNEVDGGINGVPSAKQLFLHLLIYLRSEPVGSRDRLDSRLLDVTALESFNQIAIPQWDTEWKPTKHSANLIYDLGAPFGSQVMHRFKDQVSDEVERDALCQAHGRLFFATVINHLRKFQIRAWIIHGSKSWWQEGQASLDGRSVIFSLPIVVR